MVSLPWLDTLRRARDAAKERIVKILAVISAPLALLVGCALPSNETTSPREPILFLSAKRVKPENPEQPLKFVVTLIAEEKGKTSVVTKVMIRDSQWVGMARGESETGKSTTLPRLGLSDTERDWISSMGLVKSGQFLLLMCKDRKDSRIDVALRAYDLREGQLRSSIHLDLAVADGAPAAIDANGSLTRLESSSYPRPEASNESAENRDTSGTPKELTIRELGADGRVVMRNVSADALLREQETRVFRLREIRLPYIDPKDPTARIEDWEFYAVVEALLTRDTIGKRVGLLNFDSQTACFIVRDSVLVLDRVGALLSAIGDDSTSDKLRELLRAREEAERVAMGLKPSEHDRKPSPRGHLKLGRLPELLEKVRVALAWRLEAGQSQREVLRGPLLELKGEIDRVHRGP